MKTLVIDGFGKTGTLAGSELSMGSIRNRSQSSQPHLSAHAVCRSAARKSENKRHTACAGYVSRRERLRSIPPNLAKSAAIGELGLARSFAAVARLAAGERLALMANRRRHGRAGHHDGLPLARGVPTGGRQRLRLAGREHWRPRPATWPAVHRHVDRRQVGRSASAAACRGRGRSGSARAEAGVRWRPAVAAGRDSPGFASGAPCFTQASQVFCSTPRSLTP